MTTRNSTIPSEGFGDELPRQPAGGFRRNSQISNMADQAPHGMYEATPRSDFDEHDMSDNDDDLFRHHDWPDLVRSPQGTLTLRFPSPQPPVNYFKSPRLSPGLAPTLLSSPRLPAERLPSGRLPLRRPKFLRHPSEGLLREPPPQEPLPSPRLTPRPKLMPRSRLHSRPPPRTEVGPIPTRKPLFGPISPPPGYQSPPRPPRSETHSPSSHQAATRPKSDFLRMRLNAWRAAHAREQLPLPHFDPQVMHRDQAVRQPSSLGGLTTEPLPPMPSPVPTRRFSYSDDHLVELQSPQYDRPQECVVDFHGTPRRGFVFRGEVFVSLGMPADDGLLA